MEISDSESEEDVSEDEAGDMNIAGTDAADATTTTGTAGSGSAAASEEQERKKEQTRVIDWYDTSNPYPLPHTHLPIPLHVFAFGQTMLSPGFSC
jgi:hypothetical protein